MRFDQLITAVPDAVRRQAASRVITSIEFDSRRVEPGACFVCRRGLRADAHDYVDAAVRRGAVAVVAERPLTVPPTVGLALVPNGRRALAALSLRFWGHPDRRLGLIGVTGTDGKTTTTRLIAWLLEACGLITGELSTVGIRLGEREIVKRSRLTTPEAPQIAKLLHEMAHDGVAWAVVEVASHALELARVDGFAFDRAVVTNVTHEHLDVHGSLDKYRRAKRRLLELLDATNPAPRGRVAILNADDPVVAGFARGLASDVVTFGLSDAADVRVRAERSAEGALQVSGRSPWGDWQAHTLLLGSWNAANIAAAVACAGSIAGEIGPAVAALERFRPIAGRMDPVERGQPFRVIVDFAHTPASLKACLRELRPDSDGRLIAVFGSAGEQDRAKRPMLGRVAAHLADHVVITDEDPRGEDPRAIADEIVEGGRGVQATATFDVVLDRRAAIRHALGLAHAGDTVVLTGKGHESSIIYADREEPWDERTVVSEELAAAGYDG